MEAQAHRNIESELARPRSDRLLKRGSGSPPRPFGPPGMTRNHWRIGRGRITLRERGCGARQETHIPGALSISKGAVPGPVPGPGHTAPTYVVGSRDRFSNGFRGSALFMHSPSPADIKDTLRREAFARRDALDRDWRRQAAQTIARRAL